MDLYEKYHQKRKFEKRIISDHDYTHRYLLSILKDRVNTGKKALDIGCGTGTVATYLASQGLSVLGIDISVKAIRIARVNVINLGFKNKVEFRVSDFMKSKLSETYDLIICSETLEHLEYDNQALRKIFRLLKKNKYVIFSIPLKSSLLYRLGLLDNFDRKVGHLRRYDAETFLNQVKQANFKILKTTKNQGIIRDWLFTSQRDSIIVALANRNKFISNILEFIDRLSCFAGHSNLTVLAKKT